VIGKAGKKSTTIMAVGSMLKAAQLFQALAGD
jgi:hypothetical protein